MKIWFTKHHEASRLSFNLNPTPERNMILDLACGRLGIRIVPGSILVDLVINYDVVVTRGSFPRAFCVRTTLLKMLALDRSGRKIVVTLDDNCLVALRQYLVIPRCFHDFPLSYSKT